MKPAPVLAGGEKSCPSSRCEPGATVIGALGSDGRIHNFQTPLVVDEAFAEKARRSGDIERRIRFAGKCVEGQCKQWTGSACGVIERVLTHLQAPGAPDLPARLQPCVIRASCRWYSQRGALACKGCAFVVTDTRELEAVSA